MSVLVKGWSIPTDGCCGCHFRTGKYCGILSKNERVLEYAERFTRPNNCPLTELIPCVDCKYWDVSKSNIMNHTCYWGYFLKKEDDYCSWAKPKEEESK